MIKKYLIGLIIFLSVILAGLIVMFGLVVSGTVTRETFGIERRSDETLPAEAATEAPTEVPTEAPTAAPDKKIVVLDPGHGKSSGSMSAEEKVNEGWVKNSSGAWGEWRHFKSGTMWQDCEGSGCSGRAPKGGGCWYPISNGDRSVEPDINLSNAMFAKRYLEELGYEVRLTRSSSEENPSMSKRLMYCYPDCDTSVPPDADVFVCLHSNAGGGRGSAYMSLSGRYDQAGVMDSVEYTECSNRLGRLINDRITVQTSLDAFAGGEYEGLPEAILFCKSPVPIAYLEIGFFDDAGDLEILRSESEKIGCAVADGINDYFK